MKKLNTNSRIAAYIKWCDRWGVDEHDDRAFVLPLAVDAFLDSLAVLSGGKVFEKPPLTRRLTNYEVHIDIVRKKRAERENFYAEKQIAILESEEKNARPIDAYRAYAEARGLSARHINAVIKEMMK